MSEDTGPVALINVFELPAEQVDAFVDQWHQVAEHLSTASGFRSTQLQRALTPQARFQLINIAHWDSREAFEAAVSTPEFQAHSQDMPQAAANPALYQVVAEYGTHPEA